MISVLFVCLGNICRSPMGEAIFRDLLVKEGLEKQVTCDSAGTGDWHIGSPPHKGTQDILMKQQISFEGIKARQVVENDLTEFDYIIAMDAENVGNLRSMAGYDKSVYIGRLLDFVKNLEVENVPDPYFTGNFDEVYELIKTGCSELLKEIIQERGLKRE